jgi:hypothetical protein
MDSCILIDHLRGNKNIDFISRDRKKSFENVNNNYDGIDIGSKK